MAHSSVAAPHLLHGNVHACPAEGRQERVETVLVLVLRGRALPQASGYNPLDVRVKPPNIGAKSPPAAPEEPVGARGIPDARITLVHQG